MGLMDSPKTPAVRSAIKMAVAFILSQELGNGGFHIGVGFMDEITEVDGEVLPGGRRHASRRR